MGKEKKKKNKLMLAGSSDYSPSHRANFFISSFQYDSRMWTAEEVAIADCLQGIGPGDIVP